MKNFFAFCVCAAITCCSSALTQSVGSPDRIIPLPQKVIVGTGVYLLPEHPTVAVVCGPSIVNNSANESGATIEISAVDDFCNYILSCPLSCQSANKYQNKRKALKDSPDIVFYVGDVSAGKNELGSEAYSIDISAKGIEVRSADFAGAFYAVQTLLQMTLDGTQHRLQQCIVEDAPHFSYRGLMVDVSRHFRSVDFLKKQMDAMALLKLNRMHLHLTDAAGWRVKIEAYPKLSGFAAWRPLKKWSDWWAGDRQYCPEEYVGAYGGYYTREDINELVAYARERHIELIPEIEMPGHSEEVVAAYPQIGCTGQPGGSDICPGKEYTFEFFETVLTEIMEMFPSKYIHIGGDEAGKGSWHDCPDCRARMEAEGLADVDELQSYLIKRIERFVNSKGRKIIGWDEILSGGLPPDATVMSWRGTEGGVKAIAEGHDVIMTPGAYCYLDYGQDAPFKEPVSMGGYTTLEKVYGYSPEKDIRPEDRIHLLGVQGNLWSEYVTEDSHAEYMYYPRAFAIAETGWTAPDKKNFNEFRCRALGLSDLLKSRGYNTFDLRTEYGERKESLRNTSHKAVGAEVAYDYLWHKSYPSTGKTALTDGKEGGWAYGDGRWQGFLSDFSVTVDLGTIQPIHYIGAVFMHCPQSWVYLPTQVRISVSDDGEQFREICVLDNTIPYRCTEILYIPFSYTGNISTRYIRMEADKYSEPGSWLFTDEIVVN